MKLFLPIFFFVLKCKDCRHFMAKEGTCRKVEKPNPISEETLYEMALSVRMNPELCGDLATMYEKDNWGSFKYATRNVGDSIQEGTGKIMNIVLVFLLLYYSTFSYTMLKLILETPTETCNHGISPPMIPEDTLRVM
jgi:hypothetical protein